MSFRSHIKTLLIACLATLLVEGAFGQAPAAPQSPLRLGFGFLGTAYQGDLTTQGNHFHRFSPGFNASLQFASQKLITPQVNAGFGGFTAQDRDIPPVDGIQPNTYVQTNFFYVDLRLKARLFRRHKVNPFGSIGLGLLGYTPHDQNGQGLVDNSNTRNPDELYGSITAGFPMSLGIEFHMNPILSLGLEYTRRGTGSDYLDNIGQLGPAAGNDRLHHLQVALFFTLDPDGLND